MAIDIHIDTKNEAFMDGNERTEIARVLIEIANGLKRGRIETMWVDMYLLKDSNDENCGRFEVS